MQTSCRHGSPVVTVSGESKRGGGAETSSALTPSGRPMVVTRASATRLPSFQLNCRTPPSFSEYLMLKKPCSCFDDVLKMRRMTSGSPTTRRSPVAAAAAAVLVLPTSRAGAGAVVVISTLNWRLQKLPIRSKRSSQRDGVLGNLGHYNHNASFAARNVH